MPRVTLEAVNHQGVVFSRRHTKQPDGHPVRSQPNPAASCHLLAKAGVWRLTRCSLQSLTKGLVTHTGGRAGSDFTCVATAQKPAKYLVPRSNSHVVVGCCVVPGIPTAPGSWVASARETSPSSTWSVSYHDRDRETEHRADQGTRVHVFRVGVKLAIGGGTPTTPSAPYQPGRTSTATQP